MDINNIILIFTLITQFNYIFSKNINDNHYFNLLHSKILQEAGFNLRNIDQNIIEDSFLPTNELITKYGYPAEMHQVTTDDGYILEIHRISKPTKQPILLVHGILDSSSTWIIMGPKQGLGYMLADLDYDVWMINTRGNRYSRNHTLLNPDEDSKFWQFSFHEIGKFDIPVTIDYILNVTNYQKIHYIGHSQGSTVFWIFCDLHPNYTDKILSMQALGPIAYVKHCKSPVIYVMKLILTEFHLITRLIGLNELLPHSEFFTFIGNLFCKDEAISQIICKNVIFLIGGYNKEQVNETMLPVIIGHTPAGSSTKQIIHFGQLKKSNEFRQYDHGYIGNYIKYGKFIPPDYNLTKIQVKVALHYAKNDWLADTRDVERLHQQLPKPIGSFLVQNDKFNHLDFTWGINARNLLYNRVVKIMKLIEKDEIKKKCKFTDIIC